MVKTESEKLTPEKFAELVRNTPDSQLENILNIAESNMEILVGPAGQSNPKENLRESEETTEKFLEYFKNSPDWQDNKQYWVEQSKNALYPEEREIASIRAKYDHFKHKDGYIGVMVQVNRNTFGEEGKFATDVSFYDLEENPKNKSNEKKRVIADTFCELMKFAKENNMQYVVKDSLWVYTGDMGFLVRWKPDSKSAKT